MFRSFFLAGFEGSTGYNIHRNWFDQIAATQHERHVEEDYARIRAVGIHATREAVRWPLVDQGGRFDFSSVDPFVRASRRHHIDVIWDLFHYGFPSDVDLFSPEFPRRFARYCAAVARHLCPDPNAVAYFTPINEASFFAWAAGEVGDFAPHCRQRGPELKVALARAAIAGINAIWSVLPRARIVNVDPLCRVAAPVDRPDLADGVARFNRVSVFETFDMLCGRLRPDLGGSRRHLDIVGVNYYTDNQWELGPHNIPLAATDPRRVPLSQLLYKVWRRYGGPFLITETAHKGAMRPEWMDYIARECSQLLSAGVPLAGVCLYPIIGMPQWHTPHHWELMGLWDLVDRDSVLHREMCEPMLHALQLAQRSCESLYLAQRYIAQPPLPFPVIPRHKAAPKVAALAAPAA